MEPSLAEKKSTSDNATRLLLATLSAQLPFCNFVSAAAFLQPCQRSCLFAALSVQLPWRLPGTAYHQTIVTG